MCVGRLRNRWLEELVRRTGNTLPMPYSEDNDDYDDDDSLKDSSEYRIFLTIQYCSFPISKKQNVFFFQTRFFIAAILSKSKLILS